MYKTHTLTLTHTHTMYTTLKHNVENIYSDQPACTGCSAVVSPLALVHAAPNPPESPTRLKWSTEHIRESKRQEIHPLPEEQEALSAASHQPAETLAGIRAGSGPPAQPSWEPGKSMVLLWQRASPSSERKDTQKKKHFTFPLGKSFCSTSLVACKSLARREGGGEEMRGCTGWSRNQHHK